MDAAQKPDFICELGTAGMKDVDDVTVLILSKTAVDKVNRIWVTPPLTEGFCQINPTRGDFTNTAEPSKSGNGDWRCPPLTDSFCNWGFRSCPFKLFAIRSWSVG